MRESLLVVALCAGLVAGACNADDGVDPLVGRLTDLCDAVSGGVELSEQESAFLDRAHDAVHELAQKVTESDPGIGAELLEAKQKIEAELTEHFDDPIPMRSFSRLIDATNSALAEIDLETLSC